MDVAASLELSDETRVALAALPPDVQQEVQRAVGQLLPEQMELWDQLGGLRLEPALRHMAEWGAAPVALIDADFICRSGTKLPRRQDLPAEAFISLAELKDSLNEGGVVYGNSLNIIVVSHAWLQPDDPDPMGEKFERIATVLRIFLDDVRAEHEGARIGVFFDFWSLHQKDASGERSEAEEALFGLSLDTMHIWYTSQNTIVLKLTELPVGYPDGYTFPAGVTPNMAPYSERGWCFFESMISAVSTRLVLDISKYDERRESTSLPRLLLDCESGRPAPLAPAQFRTALEAKVFTSRNADFDNVARLYEVGLREEYASVQEIRLNYLCWTDEEASTLANTLIEVGSCLQVLTLEQNQLTNHGAAALVEALAVGALPNCHTVELYGNSIDQGMLDTLQSFLQDRVLTEAGQRLVEAALGRALRAA